MTMVPMTAVPGICKVNSPYADSAQSGAFDGRSAHGRYSDGNKIRFVAGFPEKIAGWTAVSTNTMSGVPRGMLNWIDNLQVTRTGIGTHQKLYWEAVGVFHDITPLKASVTGTLTAAITTTNGSATVTIAHTAHGQQTNDYVQLTASAAVGGVTVTGVFPITAVNANSYTVTLTSTASSSATGGGTLSYIYYRKTLATNPFATTSGSPTVTVTDPGHGASAGDYVTFGGGTAVGGLTISGNYAIQSVSGLTYTITAGSNASSTAMGGGNPNAQYEIPIGTADVAALSGYGTGGYGQNGYGQTGTSTVGKPQRVWSICPYGQQILCSPTGGGIYVFDPSSVITRAYPLYNAPSTVQAMFVTPERFVIALGVSGNLKQMAWPDQNDYTNWTSTPTNTANSGRNVQNGSALVAGIGVRNGVSLLFTDTTAFSHTYTTDNNVYATEVVGDASGLIGQLAVTVQGSVAYWMSDADFWMWNGAVQPLPSDDIRDYVFSNLNTAQSAKCVAASNRSKKEIWFFYPSTNSTEIDSYVIYHIDQACWSIGTLQRTSWVDRGLVANPLATDASGNLYNQETGTDAAGAALDAYITFAPSAISNGNTQMDVLGFMPDFERVSGNTTVTILTRTYPNDSDSTDGPYTIAPDGSTPRIDTRSSGRFAGFKLESNVTSGDFRLGLNSVDVQPSAARI